MTENPGFNHTVKMWVFKEMVEGRDLAEIINETHENVKYLKGFTIPDNVVIIGHLILHTLHPDLYPPMQVACTSITETVKGADILIFVLPHQVTL